MTTPKPLTRRQSRAADAPDQPASRVAIIAIAGGSGAGKTWLAQALARRLRPHAGIVALDDFYRDLGSLPPSRRDRVNFDAPDALDWELFDACLERIRSGRPVALPRYDFRTHSRQPTPRRWTDRPIVLVEGLWPWTRRAQQRHYSLRIFRDGPETTRLERRLRRDLSERGRTPASVRLQWNENAEPMRLRHVQPQAASADITVGVDVSDADLDRLADLVRHLAGLTVKRSATPSGAATRPISARAPGSRTRQAPPQNDRP